MDLSKLNTVEGANQGFELRLCDPATNDDLDIYITVLGRDSDEYRTLSNTQQQKRISKMSRSGTFKAGAVSTQEFERDALELLAAVTKSWRQVVKEGDQSKELTTLTVNGEELVFSKANAMRLYKEYPWVKEQVDAAVVDRANFLKR